MHMCCQTDEDLFLISCVLSICMCSSCCASSSQSHHSFFFLRASSSNVQGVSESILWYGCLVYCWDETLWIGCCLNMIIWFEKMFEDYRVGTTSLAVLFEKGARRILYFLVPTFFQPWNVSFDMHILSNNISLVWRGFTPKIDHLPHPLGV